MGNSYVGIRKNVFTKRSWPYYFRVYVWYGDHIPLWYHVLCRSCSSAAHYIFFINVEVENGAFAFLIELFDEAAVTSTSSTTPLATAASNTCWHRCLDYA